MAASVCVVVLPDFAGVVLVWSVELCCVLADEVDDELDEEALVELLLSVLLLAASWLFVDGSGGGGASCTLDESAEDDESDADEEGGGENDGAGGVLAICAAAPPNWTVIGVLTALLWRAPALSNVSVPVPISALPVVAASSSEPVERCHETASQKNAR